MARLPFNPQRVPSPTPAPVPPASAAGGAAASGKGGGKGSAAAATVTVTQAAAMIRTALTDRLPARLRIVGEVSNLSARGHFFFSLKDAGATLRCVCFASAVRKLGFELADGMQVVAAGRIDYYDAQGQVQLYVDAMEPVGQGVLELKFRALCEELRRAGYFDESRKKPLPAMSGCVAIVTSRTGAALQDVINTATRRWPGCRLLLHDVRVQGASAAPEIARAIEAISRDGAKLGVEAILLTRGGGSLEDLWAFNERVVADAIFRCRLPLVAAIGHETDTTVAELVADRRCSTPTQAAMVLVPDRVALEQQVGQLRHRLALVLRRRAQADVARVEAAARHPIFRRPLTMVEPHRQQLERLAERLRQHPPRRLQAAQDRLKALGRQLGAVSPANVLSRGYSYTLGPDGKVLLDPQQVAPGDALVSVLARGRVSSRVTGQVERSGGASAAAPTAPAPEASNASSSLPAAPAPGAASPDATLPPTRPVPASPAGRAGSGKRRRKSSHDASAGLFDPPQGDA